MLHRGSGACAAVGEWRKNINKYVLKSIRVNSLIGQFGLVQLGLGQFGLVCGRRFYKGCTKYRSGLSWRRELSLNSEAFNSSTPSRDARRVEVASPAIYLPLIFTRGVQTRRTLTTPFEFAATSTDSSLRHAHALMKPRGSFASRANPMDAMGDERSLR